MNDRLIKVIGAFAFIATSWTIVEDKAEVDRVSTLKNPSKIPKQDSNTGEIIVLSVKINEI